jgi:gamma-glutamyl-gamma-aminobutyraldehyde dehydrogenase
MSDVLSHDEYQSIAASLVLPRTAFIDGKFQASRSKKTFATINPATGETLSEIAACNATDVDFAVEKAREAFDEGRWSRLHPSTQSEIDPPGEAD